MSGSPLLARIAHGSAVAFGIYIGAAGLSYLAQLLLARIIGAYGYGAYAYVFAWMTILAYFCALGFDVSLLRFVPAYRAQMAWGLMRGVIRFAERLVATVGIGAALAGAAVVATWPPGMPHQLQLTFLHGFVLVPVLALLWIRGSVVRAFGGVLSALAPDRMVRDGVMLCLVGLAGPGLGWHVDAPLAMDATLVGAAAGLCLVSLAARRLRPRGLADVAPAHASRLWLRAASALMLMGAAEALMNRTGVVLLGWTGAIRDAGIYAIAFNVAFLVALPRTAVNALFAPAISEMFVRNDVPGLRALVAKTATWTLLGAALIALPLFVFAGPILSMFGRDFGAGASTVRILLIGQMIVAASGSQSYIMTMTGHEGSAARLLIASTMGNAVLCFLLIEAFGRDGAAVGTTVTLLVWNLAMAVSIWRRLKLLPGLLSLLGRPPPVPSVRTV